MIDPRLNAVSREDKSLSAGQKLEARDEPHPFVALEFAQLLFDLAETLDLQFETRAVAISPPDSLRALRVVGFHFWKLATSTTV
jgi:hypothetical protein